MTEQELIERLADQVHDSWSHWQSYVFQKCGKNLDGTVTIPAPLVERWQRQINTPYEQLSEPEKDSDRKEVERFLPIIEAYLKDEASYEAQIIHVDGSKLAPFLRGE